VKRLHDEGQVQPGGNAPIVHKEAVKGSSNLLLLIQPQVSEITALANFSFLSSLSMSLFLFQSCEKS
jgi:hypothetical protein